MKLNDEMCEMAINNKNICTIYNDDYVVLKKTMPVTDDKLEWYIETLRKLKNSGVKISTVVDYRMLPETTHTYNDCSSYTEGIFLEERAKGNSLDSSSIYLRTNKDYDFNEVVSKYLKLTIGYIEELELRADVPQEVYDKLIEDCQSIQKAGLTIDPKPLNFFFDKECGYTVIDVIPNDSRSNEDFSLHFPQYMFGIAFGFGRPTISVDFKYLSVLSKELNERIDKAGKIVEAKIVSALRKYGFSEEVIVKAIAENRFRYENKLDTVEVEDMEDYIAQNFMSLKEENEKKKNEPDDIVFSW